MTRLTIRISEYNVPWKSHGNHWSNSFVTLLTFRPKYLDIVLCCSHWTEAFSLSLLLQRQSGGQERAEELQVSARGPHAAILRTLSGELL